jgi:hypothetical protein
MSSLEGKRAGGAWLCLAIGPTAPTLSIKARVSPQGQCCQTLPSYLLSWAVGFSASLALGHRTLSPPSTQCCPVLAAALLCVCFCWEGTGQLPLQLPCFRGGGALGWWRSRSSLGRVLYLLPPPHASRLILCSARPLMQPGSGGRMAQVDGGFWGG